MASLIIGQRVQDKIDGCTGTVTAVDNWDGEPSNENHGSVTVSLDENGHDNHYVSFGWESILTVIE